MAKTPYIPEYSPSNTFLKENYCEEDVKCTINLIKKLKNI